jgi:hypothetical protein
MASGNHKIRLQSHQGVHVASAIASADRSHNRKAIAAIVLDATIVRYCFHCCCLPGHSPTGILTMGSSMTATMRGQPSPRAPYEYVLYSRLEKVMWMLRRGHSLRMRHGDRDDLLLVCCV